MAIRKRFAYCQQQAPKSSTKHACAEYSGIDSPLIDCADTEANACILNDEFLLMNGFVKPFVKVTLGYQLQPRSSHTYGAMVIEPQQRLGSWQSSFKVTSVDHKSLTHI